MHSGRRRALGRRVLAVAPVGTGRLLYVRNTGARAFLRAQHVRLRVSEA